MLLKEFAAHYRFDPISLEQYPAHLPPNVLAGLPAENCMVFLVADEDSDTAAFSKRFGFELDDCANTLILRYAKDKVDYYAAVVSLGSRRLDINGAAKDFLGAKRISFAKREVATELTGMELGGITSIGLPKDMRILIDTAVMERKYVVVGAGVRETKILLASSALAALPGAEVAALTFPPA